MMQELKKEQGQNYFCRGKTEILFLQIDKGTWQIKGKKFGVKHRTIN